MNTVTVKILALLVAFSSGAFAHSMYFKPSKDLVQLQRTDSGLFILNDGHLYTVEKLVMTNDAGYSEGGSQSYHLPTGKR